MHRYLAAGLAALAAAGTASAASPDFPTKPVRMIVPYPAGGGVDIVARSLGPHLTELWGQQVVVDNRPGAGATLGADLAAHAAPDGQNLLLSNTAHAINATLFKKLPYDPVKSFEAISLVATQPSLLVVNANVPAKTVKDLIALAKAKPGEINYASSGNGTAPHLSAVMFENLAGVKLNHVPYKGAAPALTDVIAGQVQLMFATIISVTPHLQSGRIRALAVTSPKRSPALPNVPTVAEAGVPGYEATAWFMLFAPAKTPAALVQRISRDTAKVLAQPDVKTRYAREGAETVGSTPEQALAFLKSEIARWGKVVKSAGVQPE